jgi:aryl-alcohol dehydrogenase-like predicted oxidoreductase
MCSGRPATRRQRAASCDAWLLARYERMLLIPGTASVAHLEENLAAIDVALDEQELAAAASRADPLASHQT